MNQRFLVLDSFRGIAAVCVVLFHMHIVGSITESSFSRGSYLFVEFFFVLSGFVLAHTYGFREVSFRRFVIGRTFRLYPLHLFMFMVFFILELGKLFAYKQGFTFNNAPFTGPHDIKEMIPNLLFLQSWLPNFESHSWNYPAWSLSVEYYMYIIFFFTLFIRSRSKYIVWLVLSLLSFYMIVENYKVLSEVLRGISCFFAGALAYILFKNIKEKFYDLSKTLFSTIEITLLIMVIYTISYMENQKGVYASFTFLLIVFFFAFEKGFISHILKAPFFQLLGRLSYSIYMIHAAILWCFTSTAMILEKVFSSKFAPMIANIRYIDFGNIYINNFTVLAVVSTVIFASTLTHKQIEVKAQEFGKKII